MLKFLLYVAFVWVLWRVVKSLVQIFAPAPRSRPSEKNEFHQSSSSETPQMDFKDIRDAEFTEISEKQQSSK